LHSSTFQGSAQEARPQPVKDIVLVHGAFADASSWSKVIRILQAKGYNVTVVQNPLTSLADDVAAIRRALAMQNGPVILLGHSLAGFVITEAGIETNVLGLVYVAAFSATVSNVAWKTKPSLVIVAKKDEAIAPDEERFFARRMNATPTELNTSHVPMLSKPKAVAAVIMDAAAKATTTKPSPQTAAVSF